MLACILHPESLCRWYAALEYVTCAGRRYMHFRFRPDRNLHLQGKSSFPGAAIWIARDLALFRS